jgi:carboxynorspermidine decarboxylase
MNTLLCEGALKTPCYIVDEKRLIKNLEKLRAAADAAGCRILLAQKAFSMYSLYPLIRKYLDGTASSGLFEARLGHEEMGKETHVYAAAYREDEFDEILQLCGHIVFNSLAQWEKYQLKALKTDKKFGLRINPEFSTQGNALYDPCAQHSRLGIPVHSLGADLPDGITGLHFHTLCEQNSDALISTIQAVEQKFGQYLHHVTWVNFGGGHHITRDDYDTEALTACVRGFRDKYNVDVYLEPGEAIALNAGYLASTVLDVVENGMPIAILDASAACHMPDVLEMPYRPPVLYADKPGIKPYTCRLAGPTCLAGDIIGDYSFDEPLKAGGRVIFCDMAIYTMVKNNTFNGIGLPSIMIADRHGILTSVKTFGYEDFKGRLS